MMRRKRLKYTLQEDKKKIIPLAVVIICICANTTGATSILTETTAQATESDSLRSLGTSDSLRSLGTSDSLRSLGTSDSQFRQEPSLAQVEDVTEAEKTPVVTTSVRASSRILHQDSKDILQTMETGNALQQDLFSSYTFKEQDQTLYTTDESNVRSGPDTSFPIVAVLPYNEEVVSTAICTETGWHRIVLDDASGYVSGNLLSEEMQVPTNNGESHLPEIQASDLGALKQSGDMPWQACIEEIAPVVIEACEAIHVLPSVCIGQMIKESGLGTSTVAKESNNMGGIKKGKSTRYAESTWDGDTYRYGTAIYKKFSSVNEYIWYRNAMLVYATQYYSGIEGETDPATSLEILRKGGYWGNKNTGYCNDVMTLINKYDLTQYDKQLSWVEA